DGREEDGFSAEEIAEPDLLPFLIAEGEIHRRLIVQFLLPSNVLGANPTTETQRHGEEAQDARLRRASPCGCTAGTDGCGSLKGRRRRRPFKEPQPSPAPSRRHLCASASLWFGHRFPHSSEGTPLAGSPRSRRRSMARQIGIRIRP